MRVVIFGLRDFAELAKFYFENDINYSKDTAVVGFTVNKEFLTSDVVTEAKKRLQTDNIVPFEELEKYYPPNEYYLFAPMSGSKMNKNREKIYLEGKQRGYRFTNYISSKATVLSRKIGENCFILEDNTIQPFTEIGNNCILWSGNHLGHGTKIKDHVFLSSHCVISGHCLIESYSWLGVNCTLRDNITLKEGTLIAMGACVTKSTSPWSIYTGLPAKKIENKNSIDAL